MEKHSGQLPVGRRLVAGHFHESAGYGIRRPAGVPEWIVIYTRAGAGIFGHSAGEIVTRPHDVVLIGPQTPHSYRTEPNTRRWELLWAHFTPDVDWLPFLNWPLIAPGFAKLAITHERLRQRIVKLFIELNDLMYGYAHHKELLGLNALEAALLWCDEQNPNAYLRRFDQRVRMAMEFLSSRHIEQIDMAMLAKHCKLSPSRIAHLFTEQVGTSPQKYLEQQRIDHAKKLLQFTQRPISRVAELSGYESQFYFSRRFRHATGMSPSEYRQQYGA